jgi:hypothetical protein
MAMKNVIRSVKCFAAALAMAVFSAPASADPINLDQWYTFGFTGPGNELVAGAGFVLGQRSLAAPNPPWEFNCIVSCSLIVADGFLAVDRFELFDFGSSLGLTSVPSGDAGHSCGNDELACLADPQISSGQFALAPGAHSITGLQVAGQAGAGFLIVQLATVPEPPIILLLALGLVAFGALRRRV